MLFEKTIKTQKQTNKNMAHMVMVYQFTVYKEQTDIQNGYFPILLTDTMSQSITSIPKKDISLNLHTFL